MQITFFATDADLLEIAQWLLDVPGMQLFEPSSRPDLPNRWFGTVEEVAETFSEPKRFMGAWLESTGARPFLERIEFNPQTQHRLGSIGRTTLNSPSVISIHRDNDQNGALGATHVSCWNEKGAKQRSIYSAEFLDQVDWKTLRSFMGKLNRKISKVSPAKLRSYPIMEHAFCTVREGRAMLWAWGTPCSYSSPLITLAQDGLAIQNHTQDAVKRPTT